MVTGPSLPVPPWMSRHGETRLVRFVAMSDTSYGVECLRHFTESGLCFASAAEAARWRCEKCKAEAQEHERATRDD